jgi:5'-3' exonuclease
MLGHVESGDVEAGGVGAGGVGAGGVGAGGVGAGGVGAGQVEVHLLDGTYELFRHHFGGSGRTGTHASEVGATRGVVRDVVSMLGGGVTHLGVATDHVIESFRNEMWPGYKTGAGVPGELLAQFPLLEACLQALGVVVWPMVELEADDALASAAAVAAKNPDVGHVLICTPDKDLAQCVVDRRVVQLDRRNGELRDEGGVWAKFGVAPESIPDWLALVGDSADGFPGIEGWGKHSASLLLAHYGHIEKVPPDVGEWDQAVVKALRGAPRLANTLAAGAERAVLFKDLATLRIDESLLVSVTDLEWRGPSREFGEVPNQLHDAGLSERVAGVMASR